MIGQVRFTAIVTCVFILILVGAAIILLKNMRHTFAKPIPTFAERWQPVHDVPFEPLALVKLYAATHGRDRVGPPHCIILLCRVI